MSLKVGDWVRSYSSGIWQIYRVLEYKFMEPTTGEEHDETTVFSKRFVSNSYRRSFKEECCSPFYVKQLSVEEINVLNDFIDQNQSLYEKFTKYQPKGIDYLYNARISVPKDENSQKIATKLTSDELIKGSEIDLYLNQMGFDTKAIPYWTAQFISKDFECRDGFLMFKFLRVLEH